MSSTMVGKTLSHYKILEELGRGGMGVVYKGEDTKLHRTVAIKVLPAAALSSDDDRARFYREARAAASLSHPNIATVYEIDEAVPEGSKDDDLRPFIAMEFIEGDTLEERIKKGPMKLAEAVRIASEMSEGLKAAHSKDIVHRDIKAANVMLDGEGRAKILDFGLAQTAQSTKLTRMGSTLGTVAYMSPEQARGEEDDARTDIWALGVTLYEMITGTHPFGGDYEQAVVYSILNEDPEPLTAVRTGVPMELEWIVNKCTAKAKERRYQSVTDLLVDIGNVNTLSSTTSRITDTGSRYSSVHRPGEPLQKQNSIWATAIMAWPVMVIIAVITLMAGYFASTILTDNSISDELLFAGIPLPDSIDYSHPSWSPDGRRLLLTAKDRVDTDSYIVEYNFDTGEVRPLTEADGSVRAIYSQDGQSIFYGGSNSRLLSESITEWAESTISENYIGFGMAVVGDGRLAYSQFLRGLNIIDANRPSNDSTLLSGNFPFGANPVHVSGKDVLFFNDIDAERTEIITIATSLGTGDLISSFDSLHNRVPIAVTENDYLITVPNIRGPLGATPINWSKREFAGIERKFFEVGYASVSPQGHLAYMESHLKLPVPIGEVRFHLSLDGTADYLLGVEDTKLALSNDFSFSPTGTKYVIEAHGLRIMDTAAASVATLLDFPGSRMQPFWSKSGKYIYYRQSSDSLNTIYRTIPDVLDPEPLVESMSSLSDPSVSENDELLVFSKTSTETGKDIFLLNLTDGNETVVISTNGDQSKPEISPDGKWVAFISGEEQRLIVTSSDGKIQYSVTEGADTPHWSPDGTILFYTLVSPIKIVFRQFDIDVTNIPLRERFGEEETIRSFSIHHVHFAAHPLGGVGVSMPGALEEQYEGEWKVIFNWASSLDNH